MKKTINHIERVKKAKDGLRIKGRTLEGLFFDFYSTLILYFKLRKYWNIREVASSNIKWLILSFEDYVFYLKFTFNNDFHEVQMIIAEDSINKKIVLILRYNDRKGAWIIKKISHKKLKYTMKVIRPEMLDDLFLLIMKL
ncbi:TPA: hypothetical protein LVN30_005575 [Klebsiella oxytoca]|nr:hypothetical protein [Klebsiella oxytoca]